MTVKKLEQVAQNAFQKANYKHLNVVLKALVRHAYGYKIPLEKFGCYSR